tara:strand:- start:213 stop:845 length:633 start_codon:yes stop_codon:yes gene_type:complete
MIGAHRNIHAKKMLEIEREAKNITLREHVDLRTQELIEVNNQLAIKMREVELLATIDTLTRLSNRYQFEKKLNIEYLRAIRFSEPLSLVALDLDNFKPVNDLYGHAKGDLVLIEVANIIMSNIREIDLSARWGGDEFMILLPNTSVEQAVVFANKIRVFIDNGEVSNDFGVTASFGVVQLTSDDDPLRLVTRADRALYKSKEAGRNCITS